MKEKVMHNKGLSEEAYKLIDKEIAKYPPTQRKSAVIASLAIAQREHGLATSGRCACPSVATRHWRR